MRRLEKRVKNLALGLIAVQPRKREGFRKTTEGSSRRRVG